MRLFTPEFRGLENCVDRYKQRCYYSIVCLQQQQLPLVQPKWETLPLGRSRWKQTDANASLQPIVSNEPQLYCGRPNRLSLTGGPVLEKAVQTTKRYPIRLFGYRSLTGVCERSQAYHAVDTNMDTEPNGTSSNGTNVPNAHARKYVAADGYDVSSVTRGFSRLGRDASSEEVMGRIARLALVSYTTASTQMKDVFVRLLRRAC
jgi:hypothetical protein